MSVRETGRKGSLLLDPGPLVPRPWSKDASELENPEDGEGKKELSRKWRTSTAPTFFAFLRCAITRMLDRGLALSGTEWAL